MSRWLEERLGLSRFRREVLRKAFPVHHAFFLGEITLFAFLILVATGVFLALNYEASGREVELAGEKVPAAYASVLYIDSLPFGRVIRAAHHWSAHLMVAAALLHLFSKLLSGGYKKPRELTWLVGLGMLALSVLTAYTGYALPNDAFSVLATRIGYGILGGAPWVGRWLAPVFFGGEYPTPHSLPRLYPLHILFLPLGLAFLIGVHLLLVIKHKHAQPGYARHIAPGRILGLPMVPEQALMMAVLLMIVLGGVAALAGRFDVHPSHVFGPPTASSLPVKPDWYFLWVYGLLQIIPSSWHWTFLGASFGPEFLGGILAPLILALAAVSTPFLDRSRAWVRYAESPLLHPTRTGTSAAVLAFFLMASVAGFHRELGLTVLAAWVLLVSVPALVFAIFYTAVRSRRRRLLAVDGRGDHRRMHEKGERSPCHRC